MDYISASTSNYCFMCTQANSVIVNRWQGVARIIPEIYGTIVTQVSPEKEQEDVRKPTLILVVLVVQRIRTLFQNKEEVPYCFRENWRYSTVQSLYDGSSILWNQSYVLAVVYMYRWLHLKCSKCFFNERWWWI